MKATLGILFDKDGTLFDFQATWGVWAEEFISDLARGDFRLATKLGNSIGYDLQRREFDPASPVIAGTPEDIAERLLPNLPGANPSSLVNHMNVSAAQAPQAEVVPLVPLFGRLKDLGLKLGVATNDAEQPARAHLRSADIGDMMDFISGSDSGFGAKPHPGPCLAFANEMRISPARIAMVGDSRHDLLAGRAAGMTTIAVLSGLADRSVLSPLADVVLEDVGELPAWVERVQNKDLTAA